MCTSSMVNKDYFDLNNYSRRESCVSVSSIKSGYFSALASNPSVSMGDTSQIAANAKGNHFMSAFFIFIINPKYIM